MNSAILPDHSEDLGHGIFAIDTGFTRPRFDAAYLIVEQGRAAFIDTGTNFSVPRLLEALDALGLPRTAVDYVIPTHVHLDHAGGVGLLMQSLPQATLICHPRGLRHLVDPTQLWASATAVYGPEEMARSYGELVPVPAARARASSDEMVLELAGRPLRLIDTPGHAKHHHCIWDARSRGWFTGDTFGLSYRELDIAGQAWALPTSTPVQFEPEAMKASIARMLATEPECLYLTHYGRVREVARLAALLNELIDGMVRVARQAQAERHERIKQGLLDLYATSLRAHGSTLSQAQMTELLALDLELNAQGLEVWLTKN
ncbi:glyoxylase-like metal-dependent hydrolase (beta-lactamase superfamily II) [Inhella inkyongensis]|uniref:Glyoxylase-like metal-dependent hydrolase (Beta-lactamase superfamily II) n=1 Tax=Inhella inkyongensis TaxID=392593 RepID=A0A840S1R1_9BURK|nr:MBL fold metallo-hydrolase [Inhella inkyongensis]MBB5203683.1 glyoxylase-like metal-dependent hydrolase (beta-lactamase superfamily II) [Inhella inkyongensis]